MTKSSTETPSRSTFLMIQVGSVVGALLLFGGPLVYKALTSDAPPVGVVIGGTAIFIGLQFIGSGAPRIYDPSATMTENTYESGYAQHDGESVHVSRTTGTTETRYTRAVAKKAFVTGLVACVAGLVLGFVF